MDAHINFKFSGYIRLSLRQLVTPFSLYAVRIYHLCSLFDIILAAPALIIVHRCGLFN